MKAREKVEAMLAKYQEKYAYQNRKQVEYELGIDEAGRGPVFGSMIYSALWWPIELKEELSGLGFDDSKALTEEKREELFGLINLLKDKLVFYQIKELSAELISTSMNSNKNNVNLNELSHLAAMDLAKSALQDGFNVTHIYVDTVGDPAKYRKFLLNNLTKFTGTIQSIVVQPKADKDHKVVSASSICAKVTRDQIITTWKFPEHLRKQFIIVAFAGELGSGYPGDPKTKKWLEANKNQIFGFPNLVRFSWSTSVNSLENVLQMHLKDAEDENTLKGFNIFKTAKSFSRNLFELVPKS